jgi:hypothetical protein
MELGGYYFLKRCEDHSEVDNQFSRNIDTVLKGNTTHILHHDAPSKGCKKWAHAAMVDISNVAKNISPEMKEKKFGPAVTTHSCGKAPLEA